MPSFVKIGFELFKRRLFLISWISLVLYLFYDTFIFYKVGRQFYYLRQILGVGLCVSRGTATVLNLCCALVLLPLCKKLNRILSRILGKLCPGLFFFWLERAKSFHMTVAATLVIFAVIHSASHFANLWNFSRGFDEVRRDINFAGYRNESPFRLLLSQAGLTGVSMLAITISMGITSLRVVRRKVYNAFWYTHQLYLPFMLLLIIHPLSGALKEEILEENDASPYPSQVDNWRNDSSISSPKFVAIKSKTWLWIALPLSCFFLDLLWRVFSRNRARVYILEATNMAGRTISLTLSCPHGKFYCQMGQYVLLQCADISLLEWHPFTVVKLPTVNDRSFVVWIRVRGDWTTTLEKLLNQRESERLNMLVDGPFSSPMEGASRCDVAICVAAGVGITPFVAMLHDMLWWTMRKNKFLVVHLGGHLGGPRGTTPLNSNPRNRSPGRIHLLWIIKHDTEITWLADLANKCILELRNANRPDRLHLELYVTKRNDEEVVYNENGLTLMVVVNENGGITHILNEKDGEKETLLTPKVKRNIQILKGKVTESNGEGKGDSNYDIAKDYPMLGCRVRRGRPHWDRVFGYWVHLYPEEQLNLYCCGPKKLVKMLRNKCRSISRGTKTKFTFVHEGFS